MGSLKDSPEMVCRERRRLLIAYMKIRNPQTPEAKAAWAEYKTHMEDCPTCRAGLVALRGQAETAATPELTKEEINAYR